MSDLIYDNVFSIFSRYRGLEITSYIEREKKRRELLKDPNSVLGNERGADYMLQVVLSYTSYIYNLDIRVIDLKDNNQYIFKVFKFSQRDELTSHFPQYISDSLLKLPFVNDDDLLAP